ncbi:alpha-tectorin-like [Limanda limanda]|uniref:alpha-tectorin-like n=1 Tax=Limanda limanda TaxID=27771 RepID=UPI0029C7DCF8|nr:alpha-tectorin-like [Limanda limanda]
MALMSLTPEQCQLVIAVSVCDSQIITQCTEAGMFRDRSKFGHKDQNDNVLTVLRTKQVNRDSVRQRPESSTQTDDGANQSEDPNRPPACSTFYTWLHSVCSQVSFNASRVTFCFKNDCILISGGAADRGVVYKTNTTVRDTSICSTVSCDASGVAAVSVCGPKEKCNGNGSCISNNVCTVIGSTVVGFAGQVHAVPNRCGYTLFKSTSIPGFQVVGVFQERRRKDVSFLKRVILQLAGAQISLEQGSRALLDTRELRLNTTAMVVHGWELTKDQTGVTAKMSASNFTVSVHFDGSISHIHLTGPNGHDAHGLCGNSSRTVSEEKDSTHSISGCDTQYNEAADPTINCSTSTDWCNLLKQAPFTACNMQHDPEPFVTACTQTLCKYPEGDGLKCQFLEAYARACSLSNITVEEWKSETRCSAFYQGFCQDTFCSEHEFCGQKNNGGTGCVCRAMFASKYNSTDSFGEPMVCEQNAAKLTMAKCLLEDKGIDFSVLHLNDEACKGEMDNETHMVTFGFDRKKTCGTVILANNSQIIYKNTIVNRNSSMYGIINRQDSVHLDFSCLYDQDIRTFTFTLKDSSVTQQITSGRWIYNLTMTAYKDPNTKEALQQSTEMQLDEPLWVELNADGLDDKMVAVVTDSCWATDQPSPNGSLRYDLIIKGCPNPADSTVKVKNNGQGTSNSFYFNTFKFSAKEGEVFLHCIVKLCVKKGNNCIPSCGPGARRRRSIMSKYEDENPAFIKLAWTY